MNYQSAPDSFLSALSTRDFGLFAECLAPQAQARLLLPPGPEVRTGREEIARRFRGLVLARDCLRGPRNTPGTGRPSRAAELALPHGLGGEDAATVRRAGQVHDLGMVSVPNRVWIKHGSLNQSEWERVRLPDRTRAPGRPGHSAHSRHQPLRQDRRQHASRGNAFRLRERPDRLTIAMTGRPNGGYRRSL